MKTCAAVLAAVVSSTATFVSTLAAASTSLPSLTSADVEAWVDGYMTYNLRRSDVAGAVIVVVKGAQVLLQKGYGYANVARGIRVDPERTLFRVGSTSKLFTGTAVMQLVEQGKLDLDRDINDYLDFDIPARDGRPITLRNLLTHTPGFEERYKGVIAGPDAIPTLAEMVKAVVPQRIYPAGQIPAYSNYGMTLAGYIVERMSGEPFDEYIERHVFAPLGMQRSSFRQPLPAHLRADMSEGYRSGAGAPQPFEIIPAAPAGSLSATGADMAKFMVAHLQEGAGVADRILLPETARQMQQTALTLVPGVNRMMLAFLEANINGRRGIAHSGDTVLFHTNLHLFVDEAVGIFASINSSGANRAAGIPREIAEEFADRYFPEPPLTSGEKLDAQTARMQAQLVAGVYESARRASSSFMSIMGLFEPITVSANADGTMVVSAFKTVAGEPRVFGAISPLVWKDVEGDETIAAQVVDGRVRLLTAGNTSPDTVLTPMPWWRSSWLLPAFLAALGVLALTVVSWPVVAAVRRHYGAPFPLGGKVARAHWLVRAASVASLAVLAAWVMTMVYMMSDLTRLSEDREGWILTLHAASFVVFSGAAAIALRNAWLVCTSRRGWCRKAWSIALALACLTVLWVALVYNLIGVSVDY